MEWATETLTGLINSIQTCKDESLEHLNIIHSHPERFNGNHRSIVSVLGCSGVKIEEKEGNHEGKIFQVETLLQRKNSSCGYFALFNAVHLLLLAIAHSEEEAKWHAQKFQDFPYFWYRYTQQINRLKARGKEAIGYPWNKETIEEGVLERSYLRLLLFGDEEFGIGSDPWIEALRLCPSVGISVMPEFSSYSLRYNMYPLQTSKDLQTIFKEFSQRENYARAFIMGQTNHWICVVINKYEGNVESILCDSRNHFVVNKTSQELEQLTLRLLEEGGKGLWKQEYIYTSLSDCSNSLLLLHQCALQRVNIVKELLKINVMGFFETFQWFAGPLEGFDPAHPPLGKDGKPIPHEDSMWQEAVIRWLQDYFPPPVIEKNICGVLESLGLDQLDDSLKFLFLQWSATLKRRLAFHSNSHPSFSRLHLILHWVERHVSAHHIQK